MKSNKFPFKIGDKVRYIGVDGWHEEDETLVVSYSELPDGGYTWCVNDDYCSDIISVSWEDFELTESVPQKHIHYDMIVEWAANPSRVVEYYDEEDTDDWQDCRDSGVGVPVWDENVQYRFKPEEPERVFPTTSLTDDELWEAYSEGYSTSVDSYRDIANAAIKRYILEQENKENT